MDSVVGRLVLGEKGLNNGLNEIASILGNSASSGSKKKLTWNQSFSGN